MRLAHKRKVQSKLQKQLKKAVKSQPVQKAAVETKQVKPAVAAPAVAAVSSVNLTPKQQQVLDIVAKFPEGLNPKRIGLEAGQEEAKAASWATGALKKLLEENLVTKEQASGNKVIYKSA